MNDETDFELTPEQWETLKALRTPLAQLSAGSRFAIEQLARLGLVATGDHLPTLTPAGRKALIRGSSRLWDVAA